MALTIGRNKSIAAVMKPMNALTVGSVVTTAVVLPLGLVTNAFVIVIMLGNQRMRQSAMNLLVANLASADFLLLLYTAFTWVHRLISGTPLYVHWPYPSWLCTAAAYFASTCWSATVLTFVAIAVERCAELGVFQPV